MRPVRSGRARLLVQSLEGRTVPAVIAWDGGPTGNGLDWHDPTNWAGDVLPGPADDVTLGPAPGVGELIEITASTSVRGMVASRGVVVYGSAASPVTTLTVGDGGLVNNYLFCLENHPQGYNAVLEVTGGTLTNTVSGNMATSFGPTSIRLTGGADFINQGIFLVAGVTSLTAAADSDVVNEGLWYVNAQGTLAAGKLSNLANNTLTGGSFRVTGRLDVPGPIDAVAAVLQVDSGGTVINAATGTSALANLNAVAAGSTFTGGGTFTAATPFANNGTVRVDAGQTFASAAGLTNAAGATLAGSGTVTAAVRGLGRVSPGASPGTLTVVGGVDLGGPFDVELNGVTVGSQYDRLAVTGPVALGGPLALAVGFAAPLGTHFQVIDNDGTDPVVGTFAGLPQGATVVANGQTFTVDYAGGDGNDVVLTRTAVPPRIAGLAVNAGQANGTQRSRVTTLTVTFDQAVTFAGPVAAAFDLTRIGGGAVGSFAATAATVNGVTVVTLSAFAGAETEFGSLADGRYALVVRASQVTNLDGDGNGTAGDDYTLSGTVANGLYRLYGDATGDGTINAADFGPFRNAFGSSTGQAAYVEWLDLNGDGSINAFDFSQFRTRFGSGVP